MSKKSLKFYTPKSRADWRAWLLKNHKKTESIWVVIFKKNSKRKNLTSNDVTEEALCFGWIDSVPGKIDKDRFKLLVSPRKKKSVWSKVNKIKIRRLIKDGQMHPAGLEKIKQAKKNGSWNALNDSDRLKVPPDLQKAFKTSTKAKRFFDSLSASARRMILEWINLAKRPQTRQDRITKTVQLAALGRKRFWVSS